MNILKRGMVFVTFFGCCFAIALMAAALSTKYWLEAEAIQIRRIPPDNTPVIRPNSTGHVNFGLFKGRKSLNVGFGERVSLFEVPTSPEFMSYGLWVGTISCLSIGMVFAVIGALFAVINTATTPVEFITGVPGLYIWNSMAAFFNLICVILWAVQFHQHLTRNVLLYDADSGWTTEGMEVFGYSYWFQDRPRVLEKFIVLRPYKSFNYITDLELGALQIFIGGRSDRLVVVAIIVHIANIVIIFVGTYERKAKEEVRKPEEKSVNLMLY